MLAWLGGRLLGSAPCPVLDRLGEVAYGDIICAGRSATVRGSLRMRWKALRRLAEDMEQFGGPVELPEPR